MNSGNEARFYLDPLNSVESALDQLKPTVQQTQEPRISVGRLHQWLSLPRPGSSVRTPQEKYTRRAAVIKHAAAAKTELGTLHHPDRYEGSRLVCLFSS
jgi:hypothetical protein